MKVVFFHWRLLTNVGKKFLSKQMLINSMELANVGLGMAEGVSSENGQRHSLEQKIALALIVKSPGQSANQIKNNWIDDFQLATDISTATGWKMKRRHNIAIFLASAVSATDPETCAARIRFVDS